MNETNDPKFKSAAQSIARAFKSRALSWRLQDDDKTLVVVLASGPKVFGTPEGVADPELVAQLVKPILSEVEGPEQEEPASAAGSEKSTKTKSEKKGDQNQ